MRPQLSIKNVKPKDLKTYSTLLINVQNVSYVKNKQTFDNVFSKIILNRLIGWRQWSEFVLSFRTNSQL